MAHCNVLEHNQKPTDKPSRRIKRSGGQSLVRQGKAEWVGRFTIKLRARTISQPYANSMSTSGKSTPNRGRAYIPDKLPPNIDTMLGLIVVGLPRKVHNPEQIQI